MCHVKQSVGQPLCWGKVRGTKGDSHTKPRIYSVCVCVCVCVCRSESERKQKSLLHTHTHFPFEAEKNLKYTCNRTIMIMHIKCHLSWYSACDSESCLSAALSTARLFAEILPGLWQFTLLLTPRIHLTFACVHAVREWGISVPCLHVRLLMMGYYIVVFQSRNDNETWSTVWTTS